VIPFSLIKVFNDPGLQLAGNTSAVVLLEKPLSTAQMQRLASDFNQPATTFLQRRDAKNFEVRWFAPDAEIGLCGHGSAAAMGYLYEEFQLEKAHFHAKGQRITGAWERGHEVSIYLDHIEIIDHKQGFPALADALGVPVRDYFTTTNKDIVLIDSEELLQQMRPNFSALAQLEPFGYTVTAPGQEVDFVSRTLVPKVQQLEDHATGSSHAVLTPFWSERLGKKQMTARQLSPRGGALTCEMGLSKVKLSGRFQKVAQGQLAEDN